MKTNSKFLVVILMTFLTVCLSGKIQAQQIYQVLNNTGCTVEFTYQIKKNPFCASCSSVVGPIPISAGSFHSITIPASCQPLCDIVITVTKMDVTTLSPAVSVSQSGPYQSLPNYASCYLGTNSPWLGWTSNYTVIQN